MKCNNLIQIKINNNRKLIKTKLNKPIKNK